MFDTDDPEEQRLITARLPRVAWAEIPGRRDHYRQLLELAPKRRRLRRADKMAKAITEKLGDKAFAPLSVLVWEIQQAKDRQLVLDTAAWRLANSEDKLQRGEEVGIGLPDGPYWAMTQIVEAKSGLDGTRARDVLSLRLWSGDAAGLLAVGKFPVRFHYHLAKELDGLVKQRRRVLYNHISLLRFLLTYALVSPTDRGMVVKSFRCNTALRKYNRKLSRSRFRVHAACPFELSHDCLGCHVDRRICRSSVYSIT